MLKTMSAKMSNRVRYPANAAAMLGLFISIFSTGCLHMRVRPGRVKLPLDHSVSFASELNNRKGAPVNQGRVTWEATNVTLHRRTLITPDATSLRSFLENTGSQLLAGSTTDTQPSWCQTALHETTSGS